MDQYASFGKWLREQRRARGLTQRALGDLAGLSAIYVRKIEAGERLPTRQVAEQLLETLQVPTAERLAVLEAATGAPSRPAFPRRSNLPAPLTPCIGRQRETEAVRVLLQSTARLVTLTGVGGVGKTRLAIEVAASLVADFPDGVYFIDLAAISDPTLVVAVTATTLGVQDNGAAPLLDRLKDYLADKRLLLALDNFEHVLDAGPALVAVLQAAPTVKAMVTSRRPLNVRGEHLVDISPLPVPRPKASVSPASLLRFSAIQLFVERAVAVLPGFRLTASNGPAVAEICYRLDGLPLAIELAASRMGVLPPEVMVARLTSRLAVLNSGPRDMPARQQTLRAAIEWSYDLLDAEGRRVFRQLSVFAGGATRAALAAVCQSGEESLAPVLDRVASLVDHHLLQQTGPGALGGEARFTLLETIREYAVERLREDADGAVARRRHAHYFLAVAEEAARALDGDAQVAWLERLELEHDNLRAALQWALDVDEHDLGLALAASLWRFWYIRGHLSEGRRWLERVLQASDASAPGLRARALNGLGMLVYYQGDYAPARQHFETSLALYCALNDAPGIAETLANLASVVRVQGQPDAARALNEEALAVARAAGDREGVAAALYNLGDLATSLGQYRAAQAYLQESLNLRRQGTDQSRLAYTLCALGFAARQQGLMEAAAAWSQEGLALYRALGDRQGIALSLNNLGYVALFQGDTSRAAALFTEALALYRDLGAQWGVAAMLTSLGNLARQRGDLTRARAYYLESLNEQRALGDRAGAAYALINLAGMAWSERRYAEARALAEESLGLFREMRHAPGIIYALQTLGYAAHGEGDDRAAADLFRESLRLLRDSRNVEGIANGLEGLAVVAAHVDPERAARLDGAGVALRARSAAPRSATWQRQFEAELEPARRALDAATWRRASLDGAGLTLERAVEEALSSDGSTSQAA